MSAFSVLKSYTCACGYSGPNWVYGGIWDMTEVSLGRWIMGQCPRCASTRCVEEVK